MEWNRDGITKWIDETIVSDPETIKEIHRLLEKENKQVKKQVKKEFVYYDFLKKLKEFCSQGGSNQSAKKGKKDDSINKWLIDRAKEEGVRLPEHLLDILEAGAQLHWSITTLDKKPTEPKRIDFQKYLNKLSEPDKKKLSESIPGNVEEKLNEFNSSIWDFNPGSFDIKKFELFDTEEKKPDDKTLLHHLCFAFRKINDEIVSGGRHRKKFFEEIKHDLEGMKDHTHNYLKNFAEAIEGHGGLDHSKLSYLICHISNFELKPLRAYFSYRLPDNEPAHKGGDKWDMEKLTKIASRWFLKHWHVSESRDSKEKLDDYHSLRKKWKEHPKKEDIVDFWLQTDPILTIPPYQSMTNRRPLKCQSLILNEGYLNEHYKDWEEWLSLLKSGKTDISKKDIEDYEAEIRKIKSGKRLPLLSDKQMRLRLLQFILDASKKGDEYKLNEIWSIYHGLQQRRRDSKEEGDMEQELAECIQIQESRLPDKLKASLGFQKFQEQGSFGHFLNKYYKTRRQARDGRYFLHQKKKRKWIADKNKKLMRVCTHKPRQKRHQMGLDLANIFQISSDRLKELTGSLKEGDIEKWLDSFKGKGLRTRCKKAADLQKEHRGDLKNKLGYAQYKSKELKKGNKKYEGKISTEDKNLVKENDACKKLAKELAKKIWPEESDEKQEEKAEKFNGIFSFAQIQNIAFEDRSGFSNTCPVCSMDNNQRMQMLSDGQAVRASRLPALNIRLIDGAVMRHCAVLARHIAQTVWKWGVETALKNNEEISVPLILEQNRFSFEPELAQLKGKSKEMKDDRDKEFSEKEERIKKSAQGICAYSGESLSDMEIDHIIPRASKYGTLNDEANLICVNKAPNQKKGKQEYTLANLDKHYKIKIFNTDNDEKIKNIIQKELVGDNDMFIFGRYLSFINLNEAQQKAFRHALFLEWNDPLRQKVIQAINNLNRALVNGTQRYMAQCIADELWRKAGHIEKESKLNFDYFEYASNTRNNKSIHTLRKFYEGLRVPLSEGGEAIGDYKKKEGKKQEKYSHLIDAQMAFLMAAEEHKDEGSMGIAFAGDESIMGIHDQDQADNYFTESNVSPKDFEYVELVRKSITGRYFAHRSFHRDTFYVERYLPLWIGKKNKEIIIRAGFDWKGGMELKLKKGNISVVFEALRFAKHPEIAELAVKDIESLYDALQKRNDQANGHFCITWDKQKIQRYFIDEFSSKQIADGKEWGELIGFLRDELSYLTEKKRIEKPKDIEETLKEKEKNFLIRKQVTFPAKSDWQRLEKAWEAWEGKGKPEDDEFKEFLRSHFLGKDEQKVFRHQKVRKVFSLPVLTTQGAFLQRRRTWHNNEILQISADSDSRKDGNKFSKFVLTKEGLKETVHGPFISGDMFKLKEKKNLVFRDYKDVDPEEWFTVPESELPGDIGIQSLAYRLPNVTFPRIKIQLADDYSAEKHQEEILKNSLTKAKEQDKLKDFLKDASASDEHSYIGAGFNKDIKKMITQILPKE